MLPGSNRGTGNFLTGEPGIQVTNKKLVLARNGGKGALQKGGPGHMAVTYMGRFIEVVKLYN